MHTSSCCWFYIVPIDFHSICGGASKGWITITPSSNRLSRIRLTHARRSLNTNCLDLLFLVSEPCTPSFVAKPLTVVVYDRSECVRSDLLKQSAYNRLTNHTHVKRMSTEARCPLGFTGTPPVGHPTIPGFKGAGQSSASTSADGQPSKLTSTLAAYKPSTLLIVDAVFLGLCIIAAIYRDDLKNLFGRITTGSVGNTPSGSAASSSAKR